MLEKIKSLRWADYLYYALLDPRSLGRLISQSDRPFIKVSLVIPVLAAAMQIVSFSMLEKQSHYFSIKMSYGWILLSLINIFLVFFLSWLIESYLQLTGRNGNLRASVSLVAFSLFPMLFLLPAVTVFKITGFAPSFLRFLSFTALTFWCAAIVVRGISEIHGLSFGRSLASFLIPVVAAAFAFICAMILTVSLIVSIIAYAGV